MSAVDRALLAQAMNDYEEAAGSDAWPVDNPETHRPDCIHVGYIADRYEALRSPAPSSARRKAITCTCGHAFSSHRQDPTDPWVSERCKTCGCAAFDDGRSSGGWDDEGESA